MTTRRILTLLKIRLHQAWTTALVALFFGLIQVGRAVADSTADALSFRGFDLPPGQSGPDFGNQPLSWLLSRRPEGKLYRLP